MERSELEEMEILKKSVLDANFILFKILREFIDWTETIPFLDR